MVKAVILVQNLLLHTCMLPLAQLHMMEWNRYDTGHMSAFA